MKSLRMQKLDGIRKVAEDNRTIPTGPLTSSEIDSLDVYINATIKTKGKKYVEEVVYPLAKQIFTSFAKEASYGLNLLHGGPKFTDYIVKYIASYLLQVSKTGFFPIIIFRKNYGLVGDDKELKRLQIELEKSIVEARQALPDPDKWNQADRKGSSTRATSDGGSSSRRRSSGGGQTTGGEILIAESHRGLSNLVDANNKDYVYTTSADGKSATFTYKGKPGGKTLDKTYAKWPEFVRELNTYPIGGATKTAPATTAPATEAAPAGQTTGGEAAPAGGSTGQAPADNLTINVARLFSNVEAGHTYAVKTLANERKMVRGMLEAIRGIRGGVVYDAPLSLAKIIVGYSRSALASSNLAKTDNGELSGMSEKQIEKAFPTELSIIMRGVVGLDRILGGRSGYASIARYVRFAEAKKADTPKAPADAAAPSAPASATPAAAATPPATPAPAAGSAPATPAAPAGSATTTEATPTGSADDGTTKKSSRIDPRIKKLATLRRLRVRSQMEAAVESSAQLGRFRIS